MKCMRKLLTGILAAVFAVSTAVALAMAADYNAGNESNAQALSLAVAGRRESSAPVEETPAPVEETVPAVPEPELVALSADLLLRGLRPDDQPEVLADEHAAWLEELDLDALRQVNPEVIGWIHIPGTTVSYPVVQGADNQYYLEHTWEGQESAVGAVFMECTNAGDFSDFSTILYAHNLRNGTMFSPLHSYKDPEFLAENPWVYIVTDAGCFRYRIYAAYEADITGATYWRDVDSTLRRQEYVAYGLERSVLDTGVVPDGQAPVLTLSTCTGYTYARRWVVQAVLEGRVVPPQ